MALFVASLTAQQPEAEKVVRGMLLEWDSTPAGDLSVRVRDNHVYCFRFDRATAVERDGVRVDFSDLKKGDTVEIVPGRGPNPRLPRAESVRILLSRAATPRVRPTYRRSTVLDELFPRGNLTLAGVVMALNPGRILLRTRTQGDAEILLREDTRYFGDGQETAFSGLRVNARVFVRAGRNLEDNIEAYQVMWGAILRPRKNEGAGAAAPPGAEAESGRPPRSPDVNRLY